MSGDYGLFIMRYDQHHFNFNFNFNFYFNFNFNFYNRLSICFTIISFQGLKSPAKICFLASLTNHK